VRRLERHCRWHTFASVWVLVCLALLGGGVRASVPTLQEARPVMVSAMAAPSMPMASDGMPCATCCIAPAPSTHAFSGEGKEPESATWWVHEQRTPETVRFLETGSSRVKVPIRIAYCRWLD
jgi:hypothetical protein